MKKYPRVERLIKETECRNRILEVEEKMAQLAIELLYWQTELKKYEQQTT